MLLGGKGWRVHHLYLVPLLPHHLPGMVKCLQLLFTKLTKRSVKNPDCFSNMDLRARFKIFRMTEKDIYTLMMWNLTPSIVLNVTFIRSRVAQKWTTAASQSSANCILKQFSTTPLKAIMKVT